MLMALIKKEFLQIIRGHLLDKYSNLFIYEEIMSNFVGINNIRFNKDKIKIC